MAFRVITEEMECRGLGNDCIKQKMDHVDQIIRNIFMVQRQKLIEKGAKSVK